MNANLFAEIPSIIENARIDALNKVNLFLKLCALNFLNALVKDKKFKGVINYGMIKPEVAFLALDVFRNNKMDICDGLFYKPAEDCLYIRCYSLQFSFHGVGGRSIKSECPELCNNEVQWDGIRLQPIADNLYYLAIEARDNHLAEADIKNEITRIINQYAKLQG